MRIAEEGLRVLGSFGRLRQNSMTEGPDATRKNANVGFTEEFMRCWRLLPDKVLFGFLMLSWTLTFIFLGNSTFGYIDSPSLLQWMYGCYTVPESDDSHGLLIPFIVFFVLWSKRDELLALPRRPWMPSIGFLAIAILIHVLGFAAQQPRLSIVALFLGSFALVGVIWGRDWLGATFLPFSIFAFCVPIGSLELIKNVTMPLRLLATAISAWAAHGVLGFEVTRRGTQILDAAGVARYDVAAACSGIRSLISLFVLMTVFGMLNYRSLWRRFGLMLISVPLALFCNVLRLISVIIAGEVFGANASKMTHEYSGFFTYAIAITCMVLLSRWWSEMPLPQTPAISQS